MQLVVQKISVARRPKCQNCKKCSTCWSWDYTAIKSEDSSASDLLNLIFYLFLVWPWHWVRVLQNRDEAMDGCQEINQSIKKSIHSSITQSSINSSINYRVLIKYYPFPKNFQYFATSPSQGQGCYWLYRKWPANKGDCTLSSQIRRVDLLQAEDGLQ